MQWTVRGLDPQGNVVSMTIDAPSEQAAYARLEAIRVHPTEVRAHVAPAAADPTVTTQRTAKKWKAQQFIAVVTIIAGLIAMIASPPLGMLVTACGVGWWIVAKTLAWWHHG